jgi:hypothetical protein
MTLVRSPPQDVGFGKDGMVAVDRVVEEFVEQRAFPGAVLAVGKDGAWCT